MICVLGSRGVCGCGCSSGEGLAPKGEVSSVPPGFKFRCKVSLGGSSSLTRETGAGPAARRSRAGAPGGRAPGGRGGAGRRAPRPAGQVGLRPVGSARASEGAGGGLGMSRGEPRAAPPPPPDAPLKSCPQTSSRLLLLSGVRRGSRGYAETGERRPAGRGAGSLLLAVPARVATPARASRAVRGRASGESRATRRRGAVASARYGAG